LTPVIYSLTTIGESCRLVLRETLAKTLAWAIDRTKEGCSFADIKQQLALP